MDTLCTDKTGTLTEGVIQVAGAYEAGGKDSPDVLELAARNAELQSGLANPLDDAILQSRKPDLSQTQKLGEIPFDFVRKRLSVLVRTPEGVRLITKGAFHHMSAASFDTSVPVIPMAMPMSAIFNAGASLTPSPVMATVIP